jgi:transcriptional regulator with XRE-family HTH domain
MRRRALRAVVAERAAGRRGLGAELARRTGRSRSTVGYWLKGTHPIPDDALAAVAEALGTTADALLAEARRRAGDASGQRPADSATMGAPSRTDVLAPSTHRVVPTYRIGTPAARVGTGEYEDVLVEEGLVREGGAVGPNGWGVRLEGDELNGWGAPNGGRLVAGWTVFVNPDAAAGVPAEAWEGQLVVGVDLAGALTVGVLVRAAAGNGPGLPWAVSSYRAGVPLERQVRRRLSRLYGIVAWHQGPGYAVSGPLADGDGG